MPLQPRDPPPSLRGTLHCLFCDRTRALAPHGRAQHPLVNAYNWLVRSCDESMAPLTCGITYEAHGDPTPSVCPYGVRKEDA